MRQALIQASGPDRLDQRNGTGLDTIFDAAVSVWTRGYNPIFFTLKVLLAPHETGLRNPDSRWLGALFS